MDLCTSALFLERRSFCGSRKTKYMRFTSPGFVVITNCLLILLLPSQGLGRGLLSVPCSLQDLDDRQHSCTRISSFKILLLDSCMIHVPEPLMKTLIFSFLSQKLTFLVFSLVPGRGSPYRMFRCVFYQFLSLKNHFRDHLLGTCYAQDTMFCIVL